MLSLFLLFLSAALLRARRVFRFRQRSCSTAALRIIARRLFHPAEPRHGERKFCSPDE